MTTEQLKLIADRIRYTDPETRRKCLRVIKATLTFCLELTDAALIKEGGDHGKEQTNDKEPRVEGYPGATPGSTN